MIAILIAPVFDDVTQYTYEWSREVEDLLIQHGYRVVSLANRPLSRKEVEDTIKSHPNALILFYDHGTEKSLVASENENAIDTENVYLLANRECFTVACLSAKKLGVEAYKIGCLAYWGYTRVFVFTTDALEEFKQFANNGIKLRIKENLSWEKCLEETKKLAKQLVNKLISEGKIVAAVLMQQNAEALVCYTPNNPPESKCLFRKTAIKLLGAKAGWRVSRSDAISMLLFGFGCGVFIHDRIAEWVRLGQRLHGLDIGFALIVVSWIILSIKMVRWLRR